MIDIDELRRKHLHGFLGDTPLADRAIIAMRNEFKAGTLRALLDELEALRATNQWLPIEGAPRIKGQSCLIYCPSSKCVYTACLYSKDDAPELRWQFFGQGVSAYLSDWEQPTHYRPIPNRPQD